MDGLESSLAVTRSELAAASGRLKKGEVEKQRLEEALQKLQNDLLRDLSTGISEVKEARERDFFLPGKHCGAAAGGGQPLCLFQRS